MRILYNAIVYILSPIFLAVLCYPKSGKPRVGERWREYLGIYNKIDKMSEKSSSIWFHASSVGEVIASKVIIKNLRDNYPDQKIIITTMTPTGAREADKIIAGDLMLSHVYFPIDLPGAIKRFIYNFNPDKLIIMEMELWPNLLYITKNKDIKTYIINARLSDKSYEKYQKYFFIKDLIFKNIYKVLAQYPNDANNFIKLGMQEESVSITGSIKFDMVIDDHLIHRGNELRKRFSSNFVWSAASTHSGENEIILEAHKQLLAINPSAKLIIIPRHPEQFSIVEKISVKQGFKTTTHSSFTSSSNEAEQNETFQVYIGDTMGELPMYIQSSDVCFMAGSLLGDKVGGHNVLEPAYLNKIILTGSSYYNFSEIVNILLKEDCCTICNSSSDIFNQLELYMLNPTIQLNQSKKLTRLIKVNEGALDKILKIISN